MSIAMQNVAKKATPGWHQMQHDDGGQTERDMDMSWPESIPEGWRSWAQCFETERPTV